jgi:hypothetical protein
MLSTSVSFGEIQAVDGLTKDICLETADSGGGNSSIDTNDMVSHKVLSIFDVLRVKYAGLAQAWIGDYTSGGVNGDSDNIRWPPRESGEAIEEARSPIH